MSLVTERDVERKFVTLAKKAGMLTFKLTCPGNAGVPDRLVIFPDGSTCFVEIKAPGKKPRPLQRRVFARLQRMGHPVEVIDTIRQVHAFCGVDTDEEDAVTPDQDSIIDRAKRDIEDD